MDAKAIADKYIARDGGKPAPVKITVAPIVRLEQKEVEWLRKAVFRCGYIPTRERDGDAAPHLSELRSMERRGIIQGLPWRITKYGRDTLKAHDLAKVEPPPIQESPIGIPPARQPAPAIRRLKDVERELILQAIYQCGGDRGKAAALLGISRKTIYNKIGPSHASRKTVR